MKIKRHLLRTIFFWIALVVLMMLSVPQNLPVILLILPFVLLFAALYSSWLLVLELRGHFSHAGVPAKGRRFGLTLITAFMLLFILQSLGQLTLRDSLTVAAIALIGYLYALRARTSQRQG